MSRQRIYVCVEGRMVPAWGENVHWGPVKAAGIRGQVVISSSSGRSKSEAAIERERIKADRRATA